MTAFADCEVEGCDHECTVHIVACDGEPDVLGAPCSLEGNDCSLHVGFQHGRVVWTSHHLAEIHDAERLNPDTGVAFDEAGEALFHSPPCEDCAPLLLGG